ncbi:MBOAT family O-acyltransferase [Clostridium sp. Ade.TY]|uniref:MBOAT family O-acyltransferase n=1 Tax=Clostridium sp. Ade.TY TaxID=1391647 RepID=UPI000407E166|nr:MBOAT family O-acyltransferase [Clostridium sp. Ade.TY]
MVFSSILFIFRFLPIALSIYYITPSKFKNLSLLILSLFFYSWGEGKYFFILILSIIVDYFISLGIEKYKVNRKITTSLLILSISFNLFILFFFKYINFFIENLNNIFSLNLTILNITLPLGISFYTFQTMSYTIDVFKGKVKAERNIINFGAYVCMFPQLIAGPIVKYTDIQCELNNKNYNLDNIEQGIELFIFGLGSKVLIANNVGLLWDETLNIGFNNMSTILAWMAIIAFSIQIYFDFNGYSLMAIGIGKMLGFNFPNNFNYPYISRSISEFWKRWHITLGNWFKEYVYIPLGGNKKGILSTVINLFIVWVLTGFWHGANYNFIIWGLYFFVIISLEKILLKNFLEGHKFISHLYTIILLLIGFAIFASTDLNSFFELFNRLFVFKYDLDFIYYVRNYGVIIFLGAILSTPTVENKYRKIKDNSVIKVCLVIMIFIICIAYLVDGSYNPFLYFRF